MYFPCLCIQCYLLLLLTLKHGWGGGGEFQPSPPGSISHYPDNWPNGDLNFNYAYILISRVNLDAPRYIGEKRMESFWNHCVRDINVYLHPKMCTVV